MSKSVAQKSKQALAMEPGVLLASALMGGTAAMRLAGQLYLPKFPQETKEMFDIRLKTATLIPAYQRTVETLSAKPFSKDMTLNEDLDPEVEGWLEDADMQGRDFEAFAGSIMEEALSHGLSGILVDFPTAPEIGRPLSISEERTAGMRPYLVQIHPGQILGWKAARNGGQWIFTQLRFKEVVEEDDPEDEFVEKEIEQVRVLEIGRWATWRKRYDQNTKTEEWFLHEEGTTTLDFIPFVPVYGKRLGFMLARPPMIELAHLNVKHWQSQSDQDNILHIARLPILTRTGMTSVMDSEGNMVKQDLVIGGGMAVDLPANVTMQFVEHSGAAISSGQASLDELKDEMRQAGAEMLVVQKSSQQRTRIDANAEANVGMCHLQRITNDLEDALELCLQYMGKYAKRDIKAKVDLFKDFAVADAAESTASFLLNMSSAGKLSSETLFKEVQRRGMISSDVDYEEEKGRIESDGPPPGMEPPGSGASGAA